MKKTCIVLTVAITFLPTLVMAEAGDVVVRLRTTRITPNEHSRLGSKTNQTYGTAIAQTLYGSNAAELKVDNNTIPEFDISYYITKNIAAELILALGTKHDVSVSGIGGVLTKRGLGEINLLPPTLTLQWHFNPDQTFDPYIGAGISYVRAMDNSLTASTIVGERSIRIDRDQWGSAFQAGIDINLSKKWLVNFDVKKIWFDTNVKLDTMGALGTPSGYKKIDNLDIDPWIMSIGIGKKF